MVYELHSYVCIDICTEVYICIQWLRYEAHSPLKDT